MPGKPSEQTPAKTSGLSATESQAVNAQFNRYATSWIDAQLATDPVFATKKSRFAVEQSIGQSIQPYDHSSRALFPSIASRFGLTRFVPTSPVPMGNFGPQCTVGTTKTKCHRQCLPAFLYTCPKVSCSNCKARDVPTLIWQFTITFSSSANGCLNELLPMACWICYTKGLADCSITESSLSEANDMSDYHTSTSHKSDTGADVSQPLPDHTTLARTSSHAGFQLPTGKRPALAPSPKAPPLPVPVGPVLRPGRAYVAELRARKQARLLETPPMPVDVSKTAASRPSNVLTESEPTLKDVSHHAPPAQCTDVHQFPTSNTAVDSHPPPIPEKPLDQRVLPHISVFNELRSDIDGLFNDVIESARRHEQQMRENASNSSAILNKLFSHCEDLERAAKRYRDEIDGLRAERDDKSAMLNTMDTILVRYIEDRHQKEKISEEMRSKVAVLEMEIQKSHKLQLVIEGRFSLAVFERDRVNGECAQLRAAADTAMTRSVKAEKALSDAYAEVHKVKSRSSELETQIVELKAQILELKRTVKVER